MSLEPFFATTIDSLFNKIYPEKNKEQTLGKESTRKIGNLCRAIACLAIDKYGYEPNDSKSSIPRELSEMMIDGQLQSTIHEGSKNSVPIAPLAPLKNEMVGLEHENNVPVEGEASDNYCATETHPVNPIAMCLLLTCCNKATFSKEETLEAIISLKTIPQSEQIRSWAILCQKHGIDPHRVIYPFTQSPSKGTSCQGCKHLEMDLISIEGKRRVFRFVCKQRHHLLEAFYVHERVLIAPESCGDYLPTA